LGEIRPIAKQGTCLASYVNQIMPSYRVGHDSLLLLKPATTAAVLAIPFDLGIVPNDMAIYYASE